MTIVRPALLAFLTLAAGDMTGVWTLELKPDFSGNPDSIACGFRQDGDMLTGRCGAGAAITGEVKGRAVTFYTKTGPRDEITVTFSGNLDERATTITGAWHFVGDDGKDHDGEFELKKQ
jgi:hypothetical protein